ncbi:hypothetical protein JTE90_020637 [Oedothorax gibbosus]|uniref:Uncharacterized protein n=1 Tax=Oedothorax gibbosus TaxID=931172 RepID=A0AAV6TSM0_9ARAC|nr:hypothetical protein JTE90_020637 [Oedothorax gibbosus]
MDEENIVQNVDEETTQPHEENGPQNTDEETTQPHEENVPQNTETTQPHMDSDNESCHSFSSYGLSIYDDFPCLRGKPGCECKCYRHPMCGCCFSD